MHLFVFNYYILQYRHCYKLIPLIIFFLHYILLSWLLFLLYCSLQFFEFFKSNPVSNSSSPSVFILQHLMHPVILVDNSSEQMSRQNGYSFVVSYDLTEVFGISYHNSNSTVLAAITANHNHVCLLLSPVFGPAMVPD